MTCTFFGHGDATGDAADKAERAIEELIREKGVCLFYVGNHGGFDKTVASILRRLKAAYPHIEYYVVLAYVPTASSALSKNTLLPENIETAHPKGAIHKRNMWMIENSDYVITYFAHGLSRAYRYKKAAIKKGKNVLEISDLT